MTDGRAADRLQELTERYGKLDGEALLAPFIEREFPGRFALVSSFGAEAAVLLHMAAEIDRGLPVVFIDTGKLFGETLRYRDKLVSQLGLTNFKVLRPEPADVAAKDGDGVLWHSDPDACCGMRKVAPLARALEDFDAWASGRKRFHGDLRAFLPVIEASGDKIKVNPLARWSKVRIEEAFAARDLPRHPLEADGFLSIGCMPCTERVASAEDQRAGRWAGRGKTECGIHFL
ncbi:MAG TPA: phosphoadenylyl-sulfate reductase [Candidatus Udaeobacter sp.]|nr:phosphoadenylyl-sulfate reductase [Candidatus Udaeobacter sp.]